jgi:NAD(P)-dependent dehydrogenase (short-subunit alcohol dehydrogenase family)
MAEAQALAGRIILVTGASRGIGAATAQALAGLGAHVVLTARSTKGLEATEDSIHTAGGTATIAPLDLLHGDQIDALGAAIASRWERLDGLVLNAALLGDVTPLAHMDPPMFEQIMATNVTAPYRLLRALDPLLRAAPSAKLVAVTSSIARAPRAYWAAYAASKAALEAMMLSYAQEVENISGVRVAIYDPGRTRTRMRMAAFPSEDPETLPSPEKRAADISALFVNGFSTASHHTASADV